MGRLIPLRLGSLGSFPDKKATMMDISSTTTIAAPPIPPKSPSRQRRPGPVTDLTIFPYTQEEWINVMAEIKTLYMKRQYKQSSTRCMQILDSIKDPYRVHPLYSIYLHFYAASSLELTARSLHINSSNKLPLFRQSLSHYKSAESCMEYATFSADPTIVQTARRRSSSISSSIRSSVDSVFSQTSATGSTSSSVMPSPTTSIYEPPSATSPSPLPFPLPSPTDLKPAPLRVKKKVTFYPQLPTLISENDLSTVSDSTIIDAFPNPPSSPTQPSESPNTISNFLLTRSLSRYRTHLSALHIQLAYHIGSTSAQIHALEICKKARRSNLPDLFNDLASGGIEGVDKEEMRRVELRARIARLKEGGWKRERFDGEKYQVLCDKALAELD